MNNSPETNNFASAFCPNCGRKNTEQSSFCPECGYSLIQRQGEMPNGNGPLSEIPSNDRFIEIPTVARSLEKPRKKLPKWVIVILVLLVISALSNLGRKNNNTNDPVVVATQQPQETPKPTPKPTIEPTPEPTPEPQVNAAEEVNNGDYSLVTPEFKKAMDEYEAFYDEYIAFLNKYTSSDDVYGMMSDYLSMMEKLAKFDEWYDSIDESMLSPADAAYYSLVTLRIANKLMNVSV